MPRCVSQARTRLLGRGHALLPCRWPAALCHALHRRLRRHTVPHPPPSTANPLLAVALPAAASLAACSHPTRPVPMPYLLLSGGRKRDERERDDGRRLLEEREEEGGILDQWVASILSGWIDDIAALPECCMKNNAQQIILC